MSENIIIMIVSSIATLCTTLITQFFLFFTNKLKYKYESKQIEYKIKKEKLEDIYLKLTSIINLYPEITPNDVLKFIEFSPCFLMEDFDSTIKSLNYQTLEEYHIYNRFKYIIDDIKEKYQNAKVAYQCFVENDKNILDLFAGQDVLDCIVEFEVIIYNAFISGRYVGEADEPTNNSINTDTGYKNRNIEIYNTKNNNIERSLNTNADNGKPKPNLLKL